MRKFNALEKQNKNAPLRPRIRAFDSLSVFLLNKSKDIQTLQTSIAGLVLMGFLACGGGGKTQAPDPPKTATGLVYTNPGDTNYSAGYRFVSASSTQGKLILELRGPSSEMGRGITFGLQADASKVRFVKVSDSDAEFAQNGVFDLGSAEPKLFKAVADNNTLRVSIAQKGQGNAKPLDNVLARVAVQLQSGITQGTTITLSAINDAKVLPGNSGNSAPITIAVGSLVAQ